MAKVKVYAGYVYRFPQRYASESRHKARPPPTERKNAPLSRSVVLRRVDKKDANYLFKLLSSSKFLHGYMYEIS